MASRARVRSSLTVISICPIEHVRKWSSQPIINGRGAGNHLLTSHLLFSGAKVTSTLQMLRHMNVEINKIPPSVEIQLGESEQWCQYGKKGLIKQL
ncbi:hypothetical protein HPB47_012254 [Ixodes persulcatus]|uniref:Uncharacterized protein n=1 Tax=Ixodes persulcatus TaxID=34615 RepID=A0AC60NU43_IXOPE|nr:hypothetical protein HPB47_012254 [Ixodes persulcatus]